MGDIKAYSHNKVICTYTNKDNVKCKGIALRKSLYCQHHVKYDTTLTNVSLNQGNQSNRYTSAKETVRARINNNLMSPQLLDLRHEIALLQSWLQELMDAPVTHFDKQLAVIDRIEKLVTNFQRVKLSAQALAQAENKVKLVINNVVLIIKAVVIDKAQRVEIARRLAELGNAYEKQQEAEALSGLLIQPITGAQEPINTNEPVINTQAQGIAANEQDARASASETGEPGVGNDAEQDIPSPRAEAPVDIIPNI